MRDHLKILGILNIVLGCFTAAAGLIALVAMGAIAGLIGASIAGGTGDTQDAAVAAPLIAAIGIGVAIFFLLLSLPSIIGGWGLMHYRPWSRILMIVLSAFHLLHIPLGTALGVYGLWVLLNDESRRILETGGACLPPPPGQMPVPIYPPPAGA